MGIDARVEGLEGVEGVEAVEGRAVMSGDATEAKE